MSLHDYRRVREALALPFHIVVPVVAIAITIVWAVFAAMVLIL